MNFVVLSTPPDQYNKATKQLPLSMPFPWDTLTTEGVPLLTVFLTIRRNSPLQRLLTHGLKPRSLAADSIALLVLPKKHHPIRASCIVFSEGFGVIE